jgi:hypothetical protein
MRHAQAEATLGEIVWSSGKRNSGMAMLRKSLAEFEAQLAEDPANAIVANAGNQVRAHLALMLVAGNRGEEAVAVASTNMRLPIGADARTNRGRERALVYRIALGAALIGAKRFNTAEQHLRETLSQNEDWKVNHDLLWCTYHLLTKTLEAQEKRHEAVSASETGLKMAVYAPEQGLSSQVMRAIAARDYGFAVAHWPGSSDSDRVAARRALDQYCSGPDYRYGILAVTLLETMPARDEIGAIRKMLEDGASK